ncbi:hypothetical protein [Streptomyces chryseus]|uniref:hypothetical protein n=1 Tax=Streptomyces chryseus TaxID=68186 RepID=UPI00142EB9C9|nr:hypothetical protein [Streptomyces chryseus]GGX26868.1 hypothetical protein GCM10010353_47520 [Streptomyces chryseus]
MTDKQRDEDIPKAVAEVVGFLTLLPLHAWILMLFMGALHGIAGPVPAIGYGTAVLVLLGVDLASHLTKKFRK